MAGYNSNIPLIAITPDEGPNVNYDNYNTIDEVATDVEDIYFQTEKKKKKSKRHPPKKDMYATDVEDLDGSDDDIKPCLVKHGNPISINEILDMDTPTVEENLKTNIRNKPKLVSQASITNNTLYLQRDEIELNQMVTDLEDFNASDEEDEVSEDETSDTDLLKEIIHDSGTIVMSDSVKKFLQATPSPMVTPIQDQSDDDDDDEDDKYTSKKTGPRNKANKRQTCPLPKFINNDLTDTEILQCDTNDDVKQKCKYGKNRRHTLPRKLKIDTTDSDDLEVSENEQLKQRRVTVASLSNVGFQQIDTNNKHFMNLPQLLDDGDSDTENIPALKSVKNNKMSKQFLQLHDNINEALTDVEDLEGVESDLDEKTFDDDFVPNIEANNGIIEEKHSSKQSNSVYKTEEYVQNEYDIDTENDTDEESQDDFEVNKPVACEEVKNVNMQFIYKNESKLNNKQNKQKHGNSLIIPNIEDDNVLTDIENLNSSDDDEKEIPVTVTNYFNKHLTDTESLEGEADMKIFDMPVNILPSCSRKMVYEKVNKDNVSEIFTTFLPENDDDLDSINLSNKTDLEEVSGESLQEIDIEDDFIPEFDEIDENNTQCKESLKVPITSKSDDEDTDIEDINNVKVNRKKSNKRYLQVTENETDKLTDIEDLELDETENVDRFDNLQIIDNNVTSKTDVEDFDASDNETDIKALPEYSRTPDILRQMGGETICSQEGTGHFSKLDKKKLNDKHKILTITATSPSPTNTDEFLTSADDENYSRAETATPLQMRQELDEASSFNVHSQNTKKMDLEAEDEVMYLKGGGFIPDAFTDTEEMGVSEEEYFLANDDKYFNVENNKNQLKLSIPIDYQKQEWDTAKGTPSESKVTQEQVAVKDAAPQDSGAERVDYFTGNQRTLGASCSKPESHLIPNDTKSNTRISYTYLDKILDNMLAEVDKQEKLVHLDNTQKSLKPICVNSFQLNPSTDAMIEIPASHFAKSPKIFETKHEIILDEQSNNETTDDEMSTRTLNKSQDTDSLFSFESISEKYFVETFANKYKASSESLNDSEYYISDQKSNDDHVYEIVEPKENYSIVHNQEFNDNLQEIWWEGTYRDLSIVPEEDEDNISDISQCKKLSDSKYEFFKPALLKQITDDNYDNLSHHSSSDISQTTGEEYDTSDMEHASSSNNPIKAEIKLLVKTLDKGREDVEIRSVRDFAEQKKPEKSDTKNKYSNVTNTIPKKEKSNSKQKPSFTLQRLFVRSPESSGFVTCKELSKSNPELVATPNTQYPLLYNPNETKTEYFRNTDKIGNVDLYANTPFYPCYGSYIKTENINFKSENPQNFPVAYCDWLLQPDDPNGVKLLRMGDKNNGKGNIKLSFVSKVHVISGITTSPTKQLGSNEVNERKVITGETIIRDVLSKDIKPVIDQTKMFIRMESQTDTSNVCNISDSNTPIQKVKSPELPDKASKELDNKKEKSKSSKGFFSSLKSLVGRSLDSSDSESKEEKTPKKKKKEKSTPKKSKKGAKEEQSTPKATGKPKCPSPKLEKKSKALYESQELDNIPAIDEIETNGLQVTDLDAEPNAAEDVKIKASVIVDNVINDSKKAASKLLEGKIQEFNLEGTVTPEEVRRSIEPIIINEDEFLVVIEPNNYKTINDEYEDIQISEVKEVPKSIIEKSDDEEKSDTLKRKSVGFLKLFSKKDSKESDDETRTEEQKHVSSKHEDKTEAKPEEHRKSSGFFGLFSKKSKDDDIVEKKDENKEAHESESTKDRIEFSKEVQQQMIDTADFLLKEVEVFEDVMPIITHTEQKTNLEAKSVNAELEQNICSSPQISKEVQQEIVDSTRREIEVLEDVRPIQSKTEESFIKEEHINIESSPQLETQIIISDDVQRQLVNTADFLLREVENFEDVRPIINNTESRQDLEKNEGNEKSKETTQISISKEVQQQIIDTANFLYTEVELFDDVKKRSVISPVQEIADTFEQKSPVSVDITQKDPEKVIEEKIPSEPEHKSEIEHTESKPGFFSKLGEKFSSKSVEKRDESKEKKLKKKKEKKPGFFSKIGEKFSTLSDDERELKDTIKATKETVSNEADKNVLPIDKKQDTKDEVSKVLSDTKEKITVITNNVQDTDLKKKDLEYDIKVAVTDNKQQIDDKIHDSVNTSKDITKNSKDKSVKFISHIHDLKDSVIDTKENIIDITEKSIETVEDEKSAVKSTINDINEKINNVGDEIKESAECVKDIASAEAKDNESNVKQISKEVFRKTDEFIGDTAVKITETVKDAEDQITEKIKDKVSETKGATKDAAEKTGGFFSGLGKKIKGTAKDAKDEISTKTKTGKEKIEDTSSVAKDTVKESVAKTGILLGEVEDKVKDKIHDVKESVVETKEKTDSFISDANQQIKESVKDTKDSIVDVKDSATQKVKETAVNVKEATKDILDKTDAAISDKSEKIKETAKDGKDTVVTAKDATVDKIKDTASDAKDVAKEAVEKTGGFFSGLGKKIKGTAKDAKDEIETKTKTGKEKIEVAAADTKDTLKESATKTGAFVENVREEVKDKAQVVKESVVETKDKTESFVSDVNQQIKESAKDTKTSIEQAKTSVTENVKEVTKDTLDKSGTTIIDKTDKIKETINDAKDIVVFAKDITTDKIKDTASDAKDIAKDSVEKTGGFFSGLGKKIKGTAKDVKAEVEIKTKTGKEKIDDAVVDTKDTLKESVEKSGAFLGEVTDKVKDKAHDVKENIVDTKDKTNTFVTHVGENIKESVKDTKDSMVDAKDSAIKQVKETTVNVKGATKDILDKTDATISDKSEKIKETSKDAKDTVVSAKDATVDKIKDTASDAKDVAQDAVEKTGGFFSGLGKKIKGTAKDTKDEIATKTKTGKEKIEDAVSDAKDTIKESAEKTGAYLGEVTDKVKEKAHDVKESVVETKEKTDSFVSDVNQQIKESGKDTKDSILDVKDSATQKVKETAVNVKETTKQTLDKTGAAIIDTGDKINETAKDAKSTVVFAKDVTVDKVKDTASDAKDVTKEVVEKTGGFFSGLGKKIKGTAKDAKDEIATKTKTGKEKVEDAVSDAKDTAKESLEKSGTYLEEVGHIVKDKVHDVKESVEETKEKAGTMVSDVNQQIKESAKDTKVSIEQAKDSATEKFKDTTNDVKEVTKDTLDKTGITIIDKTDKIKETIKDAKDTVVSAKDITTDKIKDTASDAKDVAKDTVEKTGGFFSGLGKKIKGTAKDVKGEVETKTKTGKEKIDDAVVDTKESAKKTGAFLGEVTDKVKDKAHDVKENIVETKDKTDTFVTHVGENIKESVKDTKDSMVDAKDSAIKQVQETAVNVKEATKDILDKTDAAISDKSEKIKETAKDAKDTVVSAKDATVDKIKDTASDAKDVAQDAVEKTGGFFSGLGKKIKGTAKDTKDEIATKTKTGKEKVEDAVSDAKDTLKESAEKTGEFLGDVRDKVQDKSHKDIESAVETKDKIDTFVTHAGEQIKKSAKDTKDSMVDAKDSAIKQIKETEVNVKEVTKDILDKTGTEISNKSDQIKETATHAKDTIASAKDTTVDKIKDTASDTKDVAKDAVEKTGGFFSGLGKKIKGTAKDAKDEIETKTKTGKEKIEVAAANTKDTLKESTEKTGEFLGEVRDKVKDKAHDMKESVVETKEKTDSFVADVGKQIKESAKDTKDSLVDAKNSVIEQGKETAVNVKEATKGTLNKTDTAIIDTGDKIKETAKDAKDKVVSVIDTSTEKVKDTGSDIKHVAKDNIEKTGGFFSGLGKKIKGTAKDTKDEIVTKTKTGKEKIEDAAKDTKDTLKESTEKTGAFLGEVTDKIKDKAHDVKESVVETKEKTDSFVSDVNQQIKESVKDTKDSIVDVKDSAIQKVKETGENVKETTKQTLDKTGAEIIDTGDKINETAKDAKDTVVSAKDATVDKIKDTASDAKDAVQKSGEFFSGLGKKIKGTAKDAKEEVVTKTKSGQAKIEDVAANTKDALKESTEKTGAFIGEGRDKIKDKAYEVKESVVETKDKTDTFVTHVGEEIKESVKDTKDSMVDAKDSVIKQVKETAVNVKEGTKDILDKTDAAISDKSVKIKETAKDAKDTVVSAKDATVDKIKDTASDAKDVAKEAVEKTGGFFSGLGKKIKGTAKDTKDEIETKTATGKEKIEVATADTKETLKESATKTGAFVENVRDEVKDKAQLVKESVVETKDKTESFVSDVNQQIKESAKDTKTSIEQAKASVTENVKEVTKDTLDKTGTTIIDKTDKIKETIKDAKNTVVSAKDITTDKIKDTASDAKDVAKDSVEKTGGFFSGLGKKIKGTAKDVTAEVETKTKTGKEKIENVASDAKDMLTESVEKTETILGDVKDEMKDKVHDVKESVVETKDKVDSFAIHVGEQIKESAKETKESLVDAKATATQKVKETSVNVTEATKDTIDKTGDKIKEIGKESKDIVVSVKDATTDKIKVTVSDAQEAVEKTEGFFSGLGMKIKGTGKHAKEDVVEKVHDKTQDIKETVTETKDSKEKTGELSGGKEYSNNLMEKKKSDFICYVTTPTMQRRGIGGSQRLSKEERPALIDVSNMPIDISSDEDEYIVTEPTDKNDIYFDKSDSIRGSPVIIENIGDQEQEIKIETLLAEDKKRRPLFHIGSKDDESGEWGEKSEKKDIHSSTGIEKSDTEICKTEAQSDIDLIENKLAELGKALDDLEKVNLELEPQDSSTDKSERKLRRVERKFERMASETLEKDTKDAKDSQMTSPEIEAKREEEFKKMVSQLSQEEVSECQKLYSTLWDDITFTPSEEWDSKTPDSQPDDIQDLPQGEVVEVVYMGPVTLNKDHLVNKAGIEVDVIPIKRSPCTSPLPKKKLQNKGRARSAMGFYKEKQVEERGSLPDLQNTGKGDDAKLNIQKGSIMSAILKANPSILKEKSPNNSTSSLYFTNFETDNQFGRRKSTESLTKGTVVSAVKEWMAKSTPFGSTDNIRSTDAISLADTTISIFDDDDNDSVDMYSDSACQLESENSRSDSNVPEIYVYNDNNISTLGLYDMYKFHDIQSNDSEFRTSDSQIRRVLYTLNQFPLGETSGGLLTKITSEGSTHLTDSDISTEFTTDTPKPKPRNDKNIDAGKSVTHEQMSIKEETSEVVAEDIAYSDRKKFWETVSKKEEEKPEVSVKKRMSLYEDQIYKQTNQDTVTKKRTSIHEIGVVPPVPKPRSTLAQIPHEEQVPEQTQIQETKQTIVKKSDVLVSEYRAAFKDPNLITEQVTQQESEAMKTQPEKSESLDSESEYLKYEHQAYENPGYLSDDQENEQKLSEKLDTVPQIKRRQMSISQPPVAAARKTIFERSASLPTDDLQDVSETSVRARKQFFEQQLKKEMVIDQLMTQLEEEELQEYKTLTSTEELSKVTPDDKVKIETMINNIRESEREVEKDMKETEKKLSPISSSSSQDTKTEDDITQYTPTSVKDLTKYFQPGLVGEFAPKLPKDPEYKNEQSSTTDTDVEIYDNMQDDLSKQDMTDEESFGTEREVPSKIKQPSTESEQSISSERSMELGSADELHSQVAEVLQYKSDSISKPSDSLEVHVDKSEIEDSEKVTDLEQDGTDVEVKSLGAEEYLSDFVETETKLKEQSEITEEKQEIESVIEKGVELVEDILKHAEITSEEIIEEEKFEVKEEKEIKPIEEKELYLSEKVPEKIVDKYDNKEETVHDIVNQNGVDIHDKEVIQKISPIKEHIQEISDTVWEVSVQSQFVNEIAESVIEIPIDRQIIIEKDEELSGSVRDESDLGSEIHQDHSESYESERVRSESHSEVEQLILESLYHQKIHPDDARKIASELIDDIEAEIERRNVLQQSESDEVEPPVPHPEVAKNQISDYLRQLAESKGLDAKEVELVESVLARKQSELSKLGRHDTQTSSMEITDEDLKYSGGECDMSPSDSHENILEEQIEQLEHENNFADLKEKSIVDEEKFSEKSSDVKSEGIHVEQDREIYTDDTVLSLKTETTGKIDTLTHDTTESVKKSEQIMVDDINIIKTEEEKSDVKDITEEVELHTDIEIKSDSVIHAETIDTKAVDTEKDVYSTKISAETKVTDTSEIDELSVEETCKKTVSLEGIRDKQAKTHEEINGGFSDIIFTEKTEAFGKVDEEVDNKLEHKQEIKKTDDGTEIISEEFKEEKHTKTITTSEITDHKREERTTVTSYVQEIADEPITTIYEEPRGVYSDESKSSPYESAKSPEELVSSSSSIRKDDSDLSHTFDKPEVVLRKTKFYREIDSSSSSGNLKTDRRSGADFEAYSSSGESHYHSFEQDSTKSRPCSSDVEGLMAAGSSEYESALTSQDISSRSHITSTEYHTAVSSLSSRESMKSLDSESSGHMASIEVSEASETLVPSTFELEGDIIDGAVSQLLEDEVDDLPNEIIEPYDRDIPEHVIRGEYPIKDKKSSFDTISDSDIHGESMDISEEDSTQDKPLPGESKMKRSQEMTFQPVPKAIIADSPQSENLEMDERFGSSLEDGSVLSMSLSSQSDVTALRTVIEMSRRDSDKQDGSMTMSGQDSMSASNMSLDKIQPQITTTTDSSTSTGSHAPESLSSVTLTTTIVDENGTQSVSTQVTSQTTTSSEEFVNGPTQVDYVPEYDDIVETKKIRGHRRQESTSTFVPSMIPGFTSRTDVLKSTEFTRTETEKHITTELTLKEEHHEEMKDVDETEESIDTETDKSVHEKESVGADIESEDEIHSRPQSRISKSDSEDQKVISTILSEDKPDSEILEVMKRDSVDVITEPIERPLTPEPLEDFDIKGSIPSTPKSISEGSEKQEVLYEKQMKMSISEKSSIEEGEAEAAFSMVAHISPAHKAKGDICPILEDEDAEKHELETRERAQKEMEKRREQIIREQSPGSIPDIMVTEHMTPLVDREFHYPDLELEEKEAMARSAPQTPASISSKSFEDTDQGREYVLEDVGTSEIIHEEPELEEILEDKQNIDAKSDVSYTTTVEEKTVYEAETKEPVSATESPNSDSFEMLEKPDIIDDFVVIEEVAKEAAEHDTEGKCVEIKPIKYIKKHDEEVEEYLVKSAPTVLTRMTDLKYYPDGNSSDELGPFDFEDSPPQAGKKSTGTKTVDVSSRSYACEYDRELEASKKWIEMQFQGEQAALINAGYGYEMEFERGPLEDIKEEEATDFESSRIGSLDSQKQSVGSLGSVKDSFSSTPEYDVLAGRKFFTRSGEHDDVSMSSLQEFEHLERVISLENRRHHQGSQDSSSNGSFSRRYHASRSGQGDDVSMSSLKEFEGLETACIEAHIIEVKAKEEEALLAQIDEAQENLISESESCKSISSTDRKKLPESEEEDYEKRMFEIDEIIKQAQSNVEKFIDMKDVVDKTESMGRGDSLEEVAKVPDLELDEPIVRSTVHTHKWGTEDIMQTSTDSLDLKPSHHESTDSLDVKVSAADLMTTSTDSIEYQIQKTDRGMIQSDSIEIQDLDKSCMITSDSLELTPGALAQAAQMSDSIDEDGSRIGEAIAHDQSSSSGFSIKDDNGDNIEIRDQRTEYLLGSTDSLDPSSSTATHATYQYETDSVMSGSFTSGGSNTMVSSTDTIDPLCGQAHGVDIAAAVRKVWFDDDTFGTGTHFTTELLDDGSKPFVTEVIEPCEGDPEYSHTIHRKVELPPEIKKITFKGPNADLQLRQYIENFGEGEDVQESQEVDKDGNIHVKRVVQKRFIVKSDPSGEEKRISGPELESYLQEVSTQSHDEFDLSYKDPTEFGLTKQTRTDSDGTKTIYGQKFTTKYIDGQDEETALKQLLSSIASDVTESSTYSEFKLTRHVDTQQEQATGSVTATFSGAAAASVLRAQGTRRKPLRFDISVDDQTEVDPREHDWRFILPQHDEQTTEDKPDSSDSKQPVPQRDVTDQHQLSTEMKALLEEMEKHSKQQ